MTLSLACGYFLPALFLRLPSLEAPVSLLIRRSTLILPVNIPRFVDKAHLRGADAIMLDLEDAVPAQEKGPARRLVQETIPRVARGGAETEPGKRPALRLRKV